MLQLDPNKKKQLDSNIKSMLDNGASQEDVMKYANDFKEKFSVKKKDGTKPNSTSTSVSQKQVSEQKNGSSGTQEFEYKPVYDERGREVKIKNAKGELVPYMEKVPKGFASSTEEREVIRQEQKQKASKPIVTSSNLKKYQEATKVNEEEKASLQQEVNDEFDKKGFWNGISDGAKKGFNFLADTFTAIGTFGTETEASKNFKMETDSFAKEKKQAEQELIASKQPVTPEAIAEKAKQIKLKKKVDGLVVDKNNEFLSNLSEEEIKSLNLERVKQYKTLSDKDKYIATQAEILKNNFEKDTKDYTTAVAIIQKNKKQGIETNQALIDFAIEKENSLKEKLTQVKELEAEYISNKENIGSAEEEVDFLKRNYDTADKIKTLAKIGFGDIYNSLSNKLPLMVDDLDQAIFEPLRPGSSEGVLSDDERQQLIDNSIDWENAKELAKSKVKKDVDFENLSLSNFGQFFAQELGTQLQIFAQMAMPGGIVSIGMSSTFDKYGKMEQESNNIDFEFNGKQFNGFEKENGEIVDSLGNTYDPKEVNITSIREADKSTANKFLTSVTFGTAEAVLGAMPTKNIFGRALSSFSTSGERTLFRQSVKEFVKAKGTSVLNDTATEVVSEGATQIIQNIADISSGKKDVSIYDGVDHAMVSAGMLSFVMSSIPAVAGLALKPFSESKENKQVNENLQEIFALQSQLNNTEISDISKTTIQNRIAELEKSNSEVLDKIASRTKGISKETFDAIKDVNKKQELLILQASEISKDNSLDTEIKKKIIADLESEFNALETKRNKLASGKSTILDALSDNESARLKEKAANLLVKEEKAKGKTDEEINFTEEEINKKAIEIYNQSKQNAVQQEATITETKQEAQPQAEVKETEQEVLTSTQSDIEDKKAEIEKLEKEKQGLQGDRTEINVGDTFNYNFGIARDGLVTVIRDNNDGTVQTRYADGTIKTERKSNLIDYLNEQNGVYNEVNRVDNTDKSIEINSKIDKIKKEIQALEQSSNQTTSQENNISDINRIEIFEKSDGTFNVRETNEDGTLKKILERGLTREQAQDYIDSLKNETAPSQVDNVDGNVQPGNNVVEPSGTTEQENNQAGDVQPTDNGRNVEGEIENKPDDKQDVETLEELGKPEVTSEEKPSSLDEKIEKDKLSDVLDWLDGLKLDPNDLNATLPFLPQSWNMFIEAVKLAVKAGKTINDAIKEAVKKLKKEGISDTEINAIVDKFTGQVTKKVESGTFERKAGKKSLLSRVYEGENKEPLNSIIEDIGLDYKVENQEQAQNRAKKFVKQVGINKALESVRNNLIKGAEKAFVYAEILDQIVELSESANIDEIGKIQEDYNIILEESLNAFDEEARDAGRFISALNRIYNNSRVRYNLTKQINQYKALNKGVIDEETLIKFNEADRKLKEIEQKLKEAEAKLIEQEQQLAIKNIEEAIAREIKNKVSNKTKATKIANQIRRAKIQKPDVFNASTGASLVWDGAVEIVAKSIEAGGTIADAVYKGVEYIKNTDWYKNATKDTQKKAIESFTERMISDSTEQTSSISISDDGKIKIPESIVKDYVRQGITDINEISQRIIDDFFSGNEDVTIREVRDAITRYGKTINQSKDEINAKVRELKRIGKLISAMEDVLNGKRPLKSGLQRDKPTQVEREMMRELKDKMRDLPLDEADLETAWKNALDTYKQRLKNQIEDLEKQIDNKEKSKVKRESVKLDEEAKSLKEQVKTLRETLNNLVGKPELTEEQKINRATRQLENAIDNLTNQIANGELDYKDKPTPVNSARLTELRKQKDDLNKQLQKAREESGIIEKRRLKQAKQRLKNQIELYQKKIQNKDFSKKEPKPLPAEVELQQLQAEKIKWQEVYDKAKYEAELRDRKWQDYARELLVGIIGIPRLLMAGLEMSMVFIQGGIQTLSLATRNPKALAKIFAKAFISIGSNEKFLEYERAIKSDPNYMLMKNSKLALTETDYQMELREETFIGSNIVYGIWNAIGKGIEIGSVKILGKKDFPTIGSTFISMIKKDIETKKIPISEQFKNLNPLLAFERGNTIYMNEIRKARFMDGVKMLKMEGKNENDHKEDFKTLAKAINTLTGRTSIGRLENINDYLNIIFFSFKNTISVFQQLNPWFYSYVLRNNYDEWTKPSVAQKMAVRDMVNFVTITTSMMFLLQAAAGDDEEGNPIVEIEKDPRSSDFMTLKIKGKDKDTRFDPWHGMKPQVVLFARLITGEQKRFKKGKVEIKRIGEGYKADTHWDNITKTYIYNKFSPSMQMVYRQMDSEVDKQGNKTYYGKDFQERFSLTPMYIESLREIEEQDPDGFTRFLSALGFFGLNSSTY